MGRCNPSNIVSCNPSKLIGGEIPMGKEVSFSQSSMWKFYEDANLLSSDWQLALRQYKDMESWRPWKMFTGIHHIREEGFHRQLELNWYFYNWLSIYKRIIVPIMSTSPFSCTSTTNQFEQLIYKPIPQMEDQLNGQLDGPIPQMEDQLDGQLRSRWRNLWRPISDDNW